MLRKKGSFFEEIVAHSTEAIISLCADRRIRFANQAALDLFAYDEETLIGASLDILLPDSTRADHGSNMDTFEQSDEVARQMGNRPSVAGLRSDGSLVSLEISIQKHPPESRFAFSAICRDVSDSIRMMNSLRASESRLARAQELAHIGNWEWNIATGELHWSDEIYRIFGLSPQAFEASYEAFLNTVHPDDQERVKAAVTSAVEDRAPYDITHRITCNAGTEKVVREIGSVLYAADGTPMRMDGTVQDVTEAYRREQALREAQAKAGDADRAKTQFLSTISHELRTPLNGILGLSELLLMETDDAEVKNDAKMIYESGKSLLDLVNTILEVSAIESAAVECNRTWFRAEDLIDPALSIMRSKAEVRGISIETDMSEAPEMLFVDRVKCLQMLINLLANAIAFSEEGGTVKVSLRTENSGVVLSVEDSGKGMAEAELDRCFELFSQANMADNREHGGLGLGLTIVNRFTALHEGKVAVDSSPGKGATFSLHLPMVE